MYPYILIVCLFVLVGCEIDNTSSSGGENAVPANSAIMADGELNADDAEIGDELDAEWESIEWLTSRAPAARGAVQVMSLQAEIKSDGRVYFTWDQFPWDDDANGHFFVWMGDHWRGGKFEGILQGGQRIKLLSNIYSGYNGHQPPSSGTRVAFAWTDKAGKERSNLSITTWR